MMLTYLQAIIIGLLQGVTELFPISSLGHSVIVPYLLGWNKIVNSESHSESFFLAFLVALHVATATALFIFYRKQWYRLIKGFFKSLKNRAISTPDEKLVWLLIIATIPAGLTGLIFEHSLRTQFAKPLSAVIFLFINGIILFVGDNYARKRAKAKRDFKLSTTVEHTSKNITSTKAALIGSSQVLALFAGISRSGITMVSGIVSGLDYEDSARFSFLLATPIIFAAGFYKLPDLLGPGGNGVRPQVIVGAIAAGIAAYISVKFLDKYFQNKSLRPFAIYSMLMSIFVLIVAIFRGHF